MQWWYLFIYFFGKKLPFDDTKNFSYNMLNVPPLSRQNLKQELEFLANFSDSFKQVSKTLNILQAGLVDRYQAMQRLHEKTVTLQTSSMAPFEHVHKKVLKFDLIHENYSNQILSAIQQFIARQNQRINGEIQS